MDIFIGYAGADRRFGKALTQVLSATGDRVWHKDRLTQSGESSLEKSRAFVLVLSAKALRSDELRSQSLHYATVHNFHPDHRLIVVLLEPIPERDLWLFIRHAQMIERSGDSDAAVIAQVSGALLSGEQRSAPSIVVDAYDITLERPAVSGAVTAQSGETTWQRLIAGARAALAKDLWRQIAAGVGVAAVLLICTAVVAAQVVSGAHHHTALRTSQASLTSTATSMAATNTAPPATPIVQQATPTPQPTATATSQPTPAGPLPPVSNLNFAGGFAGADDLQLNSSALLAGAQLQLTSNNAGETSSAFARSPVPVANFTTTFTFQDTNASADGFTFTLQNVAPDALGSSGAGLGYAGITNSVAVKFNLWNANTSSAVSTTGLYTNGSLLGQPETSTAREHIDFHSGHVMQVTLQYNDPYLVEIIRDTNTGAFFRTFYYIDIPEAVGGSHAYAGFTGSTGGSNSLTATQAILTWSYAGS